MSDPSICFIVDEPGWAFDRWTACLVRELRACGVLTTRFYRNNTPYLFNEDYVYVCWWGDVQWVAPRLKPEQTLLCRITDMLTWTQKAPNEWQQRFQVVRAFTEVFVASSREIQHALASFGISNTVLISDCVDTTLFIPYMQTQKENQKPSIGWCGNPIALKWMGLKDIKGIELLQSLKNNKTIHFQMATDLKASQMPAWYKNLDIYVCASRNEGTPLSVLEALATGNIIISTAVGIVPEITSPGIFLFDGTHQGLQATLQDVLDRRKDWVEFSVANRAAAVTHWSAVAVAQQLTEWLREQAAG